MVRDDINTALKEAMKAKDARRVSCLRLMNAAIQDKDIEARGTGKSALSDEELLGVFQKMIKQRQELAELYDKGGRRDLSQAERDEIAIIQSYLPQQMSEGEMKSAIEAAIKETGAAGMKDMGKVIGALKAKHAGKMDFAKASGLVKELLK